MKKRKYNFQKIHNFLEQNVDICPNDVGIETPYTRLTYEELFIKVQYLCSTLLKNSLQKGDRIAFFSKNDNSFCELMFACSILNLVLVPINFRLAKLEIEYILNDSKSKMIFYGEEFEMKIKNLNFKSLLKNTTVRITHDGNYNNFLRKTKFKFMHEKDSMTPLFQMYTSGTTGKPKGVLISQSNIISLIQNGKDKMGPFHENSISLICMPLFHIAGSAWLFCGLALGCHNILVVDIDPRNIIKCLNQKLVTCTLLVPSVIQMLCDEAEKQNITITNLKTLVFGASPMPVNLLKRAKHLLPNTDFIHVYGLTETTGMLTALNLSQIESIDRLESCGKCFENSDIKIVDEFGKELPNYDIGQIICKSPQIMLGYYNNKEATEKAIKDNWFQTGDAGYIDKDGFIFIKDRIKDVVISGGENIYPAEVENVLLEHPNVLEVSVIGTPDIKWGEVVTAIIIVSDIDNNNFDTELTRFCDDKLAKFKIPKKFIYKETLPKNASGKVLKNELRKLLSE